MSLQPWPVEALPLRQSIQAEQNRLWAIFGVCLSEGIEEQNHLLIKDMLPKIKVRARRIQATCRQIRQLVPSRRRGRDPKWAIVALDINALAGRVLKCAEMIEAEYPANRFVTIEYLLRMGLDICQRIEEHLGSVPVDPEINPDVPAAFRYAFEADGREE